MLPCKYHSSSLKLCRAVCISPSLTFPILFIFIICRYKEYEDILMRADIGNHIGYLRSTNAPAGAQILLA